MFSFFHWSNEWYCLCHVFSQLLKYWLSKWCLTTQLLRWDSLETDLSLLSYSFQMILRNCRVNSCITARKLVVRCNGLWGNLYQDVYYCQKQRWFWSAMCVCNTSPRCSQGWNVLTAVLCRPFPLLTLSFCRLSVEVLRHTVTAYETVQS